MTPGELRELVDQRWLADAERQVATHPDALQQQQIMRNYEEFAGRKSRGDAGLASPVSDGERTVFESIFLHGDDVWSPATEGSALDFESAAAGEA